MLVSGPASAQLRVLQIFAGRCRRSDIGECLRHLAVVDGFTLHIHEVDICRGKQHDVLDEHVWARILQIVDEFDVLIISPPGSTWSRARHNRGSPDPHPLRNAAYPWGFPWLSSENWAQVRQGNEFVKKSFHLCKLFALRDKFFLLAHPEDLGATADGSQPASIWQVKEFSELMRIPARMSFAIFQCQFGADTPKPTRFACNIPSARLHHCDSRPIHNACGTYLGPLLPVCPHGGHEKKLAGEDASGDGIAAPAAHYPLGLGKRLASLVASVAKGEILATPTSDELGEVQSPEAVKELHFSELKAGCLGAPLKAEWAGRTGQFLDGLGLCSPGRWDPRNRGRNLGPVATGWAGRMRGIVEDFCAQRIPDMAKATMLLAAGRYKTSLFSESDLGRWWSILPQPDEASVRPAFQPFYLQALSQSLCILEDPDWEILAVAKDSFSEGVPVGHDEALEWIPQVFRKRAKLASYDESEERLEMENYASATAAKEAMLRQFREEEAEGRMFPISEKEAKKRYPGRSLRIAAQGAIPKGEGAYRIIHDATHGVQLNNEIKSWNKAGHTRPQRNRDGDADMRGGRRTRDLWHNR